MSVRASGRVAIIGAGPAGLGAAYGVARRGLTPVVFEAAPHVGGLARSIELWGQRVDLGAHLLQRRDERIGAIWDDLIGPDYDTVPRRTAVLVGEEKFRYPYDPVDVARRLGPLKTARCAASFAARRRPRGADGDLEQWVVSRFGRKLFDLFVRDFVEKLFGVPARELDPAFARTLIGFREHPSLADAARSVLRRRRRTPQLLVRPHGGVGQLMEALARAIGAAGEVRCGEPVRAVHGDSGSAALVETDATSEAFSHVIITLPLPIAIRQLTDRPPELLTRLSGLRTRSVVIVYLLVDARRLFREQWLYVHSRDFAVGRVANFASWKNENDGAGGRAVLAAEIWCDERDPDWVATTAELATRTADELRAARVLDHAVVLDAHAERVRAALPVLRPGDTRALHDAAAHLRRFSRVLCTSVPEAAVNVGVHGSLLQGLDAAERVSASA